MKNYSVLIIDDHPGIAENYETAFSKISSTDKTIQFNINTAEDSDSALKKIKCYSKKGKLDFVLLDISLPKSTDGKILSGEDLGVIIRKQLPKTKIIVATTYNDNFMMNNIFKNINPEGFLVKNDLNSMEMVKAINSVLEDRPYYSKSVLKLVKSEMSHKENLDRTDREILYELSNGTKMKDLPNILPLSIAGIEKRKRRLKEIFGVKQESDRELLIIAKEKGFI